MRPSIVLYGNCQVRALTAILAADPGLSATFDIAYVASYDDPASPIAAVPIHVVAQARILFEQISPDAFPLGAHLPSDCRRITFPSLDLNVIWPLHCSNPYSDECSSALPAGQFPYGDTLIVDCIRQGMSVEETVAFYERSSEEHLPPLDRFLRIDKARLAARDAKCTVPMGEFVIATFAKRRLFWTNNHPTNEALAELCCRLIESVASFSTVFRSVDMDAAIAKRPHGGNLELFKIPIHPAVARHFGLQWYPHSQEPAYAVRGLPATYEEYFFALTSTAIHVRDTGPTPVTDFALYAR